MAIRIKLYNLLAERSLSGKEEYEVPFEAGMRPTDLIHREGFHGEEEEAILVLINDEQSGFVAPIGLLMWIYYALRRHMNS